MSGKGSWLGGAGAYLLNQEQRGSQADLFTGNLTNQVAR
jgi:hypothetical protein